MDVRRNVKTGAGEELGGVVEMDLGYVGCGTFEPVHRASGLWQKVSTLSVRSILGVRDP